MTSENSNNVSNLQEEKTWVLYMHISPNHKRYIGITSMNPPSKRWGSNGCGYDYNPYFKNAIDKYGWKNFQHIIVEAKLSKQEAKNKEIALIQQYNTTNPEYGYNKSPGGGIGIPHSEHSKNLIRQKLQKPIYQFDKEYNYIQPFNGISEAVNIYNCCKSAIIGCCQMIYESAYGYIWRYQSDVSNPYNKNTSPKFEGKLNNRSIYQINISTKEYKQWNHISDASINTGYSYSGIWKACNNRTKAYHGFKWIYCDTIDDINKYLDENICFQVGKGQLVAQCDKNWNIIQIFKSMSQAGNSLNLDRKKISQACKEQCLYEEYYWKYL